MLYGSHSVSLQRQGATRIVRSQPCGRFSALRRILRAMQPIARKPGLEVRKASLGQESWLLIPFQTDDKSLCISLRSERIISISYSTRASDHRSVYSLLQSWRQARVSRKVFLIGRHIFLNDDYKNP